MRIPKALGGIALTTAVLALPCDSPAQGPAPPQPRYRVTDLGLYPGRAETEALDLNDHGVVVGHAWNYTAASEVALVWADGKPLRLPGLPGHGPTSAMAINERGQIAGSIEKTYRGKRYVFGCLWTDRKPRRLPSLRGDYG